MNELEEIPEWFVISDISQIREGDVFETPTRIPMSSPICPGMLVGSVKHVGIFIKGEDGKLKVIHNPFGGYP